MTRKELIDALFKASVILITITALFLYYNNSQMNRYRFTSSGIVNNVFDTSSGKLYLFYFNDKNNNIFTIATIPLGEAPQVKEVFPPSNKTQQRFILDEPEGLANSAPKTDKQKEANPESPKEKRR